MSIEQAIRAEAEAHTKNDSATNALAVASHEAQEAEKVFAANPTDANWAIVEEKVAAARRADLVCRGAQTALVAAKEARNALEAEAEATERGQAAARASMPAFRNAISRHVERLVSLHVESADELRQIAALVTKQNGDAIVGGVPAVSDLYVRGLVAAALASSGVPPEIGTMTNRARNDEEAIAIVAVLVDKRHVLEEATLMRLTTSATAREDITRLVDGDLERDVIAERERRADADRRLHHAAKERSAAQLKVQQEARKERHEASS